MADVMKLVTDSADRGELRAAGKCYDSAGFACAEDVWSAMLAAAPPARKEAPAEGAGDLIADLEALLAAEPVFVVNHPIQRAITALRDRTSEPAREAVGYCNTEHLTRIKREAQAQGEASSVMYGYPCGAYRTPLYLHPAPATADKLREICSDRTCDGTNHYVSDLTGSFKYPCPLATLNEEGE